MRAFLQIVKVELLGALRSKVMFFFALASAVWIIFGPDILKYDGSEDGRFLLSVRYLLGIVFSVSIVFFGAHAAGAISVDRTSNRLQLALIRPVRHAVIAFARICAILIPGAFILALSSILLYFSVGSGRSCNHVYSPSMEDPKIGAMRIFNDCMEKDKNFKERVAEIGSREVLKYLESYVRDTYVTIDPGKSVSWEFPAASDVDGALAIRLKLNDMFGRTDTVVGKFVFGGFSGKLENINKTLIHVPLALSGERFGTTLTFENNSKNSVSIQPQRDLHILEEADGFGWNVFRAFLMMVSVLAIVVSVGVFLGAALSRSVAIFSLMALLFAMVISPATIEDYPDPIESNAIDRFGLMMTEVCANATASLSKYNPISQLESSECVEWRDTAMAFATALFYAVGFSLLAGFTMRRKNESV